MLSSYNQAVFALQSAKKSLEMAQNLLEFGVKIAPQADPMTDADAAAFTMLTTAAHLLAQMENDIAIIEAGMCADADEGQEMECQAFTRNLAR